MQADKVAGSREAFNNLLTDEQLSRIRDALSAPPTAPAAASPADRPSASNVSLGGSHPNSSRPRPAVRSTEEEVRAIFRPPRTFTSNFTRMRLFACASYLTSRLSANSLSIVMKVDTLIRIVFKKTKIFEIITICWNLSQVLDR